MGYSLHESPVYGVYYHTVCRPMRDGSTYCWISRGSASAEIFGFANTYDTHTVLFVPLRLSSHLRKYWRHGYALWFAWKFSSWSILPYSFRTDVRRICILLNFPRNRFSGSNFWVLLTYMTRNTSSCLSWYLTQFLRYRDSLWTRLKRGFPRMRPCNLIIDGGIIWKTANLPLASPRCLTQMKT